MALGGQTGIGIAIGDGVPTSLRGSNFVSSWSPGGRDSNTRSFDQFLGQLYENDQNLSDACFAAQKLKDQENKMNKRLEVASSRVADFLMQQRNS